ncbi:MAG: rRNA maturation RNase YbeY [Desulfococcaceae bacterium]
MQRAGRTLLNALESPDAELSLLLVDDDEMAVYNREFRGKEGSTNVLAFAMRDGDFPELTPHLLGDVVISAETARREAEAAGTELEYRLDELLVHVVLHLFGMDHERGEEEAEAMFRRARELVDAIRAAEAEG